MQDGYEYTAEAEAGVPNPARSAEMDPDMAACLAACASVRSPFASWTDGDLYRAIQLPEHQEPGEAQEKEIQEYVDELRARKATRKATSESEERLRAKYQI